MIFRESYLCYNRDSNGEIMVNILLVEDDLVIQKLLMARLCQENYHVLAVSDGQEALEEIGRGNFNLLITDLMLPKINGLSLIQTLRLTKINLPILIISAKGQLEDLEAGFVTGADDYMVKPIQLKELILRVRALLRRAQINESHLLQIGVTTLDEEALTLTYQSISRTLPKKEFQVLYKLLSHPNKIFTRLDLIDNFWDLEENNNERVVDACIKKIRHKIKDIPDFDLVTIRGLGYKATIEGDDNGD